MSNVSEPVYGFTNHRTTYFDLENGDNVFRILPPFKSLSKGQYPRWSVFWKIHWGYKNEAGQHRPFASPEVYNFKTKMTEVVDEAIVRIGQLNALKEKSKVSGDTVTFDRAVEMLKQYRLEKRWFLNVIDRNGTIGVLKIPHKAKEALDLEIERLKNEGANPVGIKNGRFFIFRRSGEKLQTLYQVFTYKEKKEIPGYGPAEVEYVSDLSDEVINRMDSEARDLSMLYATPTAQEVARMVAEGPATVGAILDKKKNENSYSNTAQQAAPQPTPQSTTAAGPTINQALVGQPMNFDATVNMGAKTTPNVSNPTYSPTPVSANKPTTAEDNAKFLADLGFKPTNTANIQSAVAATKVGF